MTDDNGPKQKTTVLNGLKEPVFSCQAKKNMSLGGVIEDIAHYMSGDPLKHYRVFIGTDSPGSQKAEFITAIVVHKVGRGGRYWWYRSPLINIPSRKLRIINEVIQSLQIANLVVPALRTHPLVANHFARLGLKYQLGIPLEIHVDVGENGETKEMIQEVVGIVRGNGYEPKIKPEAFCASVVADRHT